MSTVLWLSREELLYLLWLTETPTLPGMAEDPLEGLSDEQAQTALDAGEHALRARGWIEYGAGGSAVASDEVTALLGPCIASERVVAYRREWTDGTADGRTFHQRGETIVEHVIPEDGVHCFALVRGGADGLLARLQEFLGWATHGAHGMAQTSSAQAGVQRSEPVISVRQSVLTAAATAASAAAADSKGAQRAVAVALRRGGLDEVDATDLAAALTASHTIITLSSAGADGADGAEGGGEGPVASLLFLDTPEMLWVGTPARGARAGDADGDPELHFAMVTEQEALREVRVLVRQVQRAPALAGATLLAAASGRIQEDR